MPKPQVPAAGLTPPAPLPHPHLLSLQGPLWSQLHHLQRNKPHLPTGIPVMLAGKGHLLRLRCGALRPEQQACSLDSPPTGTALTLDLNPEAQTPGGVHGHSDLNETPPHLLIEL